HASAASSRLLQLARPVLSPMLEKIRGGIAVSEMARRWQVEQLGGDPILIPNGVDTSVYAAALQHSAAASTNAGDATERPTKIGFLGGLGAPRTAVDVLLDACKLMDGPCRVTVMGGGQARSRPCWDFVGRVSNLDKARMLGRADIYMAPPRGSESF